MFHIARLSAFDQYDHSLWLIKMSDAEQKDLLNVFYFSGANSIKFVSPCAWKIP